MVPERSARCPAYQRPTSTTAPGNPATKLSTPYTAATPSPVPAPSPAAPNAQAVTPSRGPQPPTLSGSVMASSASTASGVSTATEAPLPATRAARKNIARYPARTTADDSAIPGRFARDSSASRASASIVGRPRRPSGAGTRFLRTATATASAPSTAGAAIGAACRAPVSNGEGMVSSTATPKTASVS